MAVVVVVVVVGRRAAAGSTMRVTFWRGEHLGNSFGHRAVKPDCPEINSGLTVWDFQSATTYLKVRRSFNGRCPQNDRV